MLHCMFCKLQKNITSNQIKSNQINYYPGHWIHFNAALTVHNFHCLGSIPMQMACIHFCIVFQG